MTRLSAYEAMRPFVQTGDLVFFSRLTLPQAIRAQGLWGGLCTWLGNALIALAQWRAGLPAPAGLHNLVHVGAAIRNRQAPPDREAVFTSDDASASADSSDEVLIAEFYSTGLRAGLHLNRLRQRVLDYAGAVWVVPLTPEARARLDLREVEAWLKNNRATAYNYLGLLFPAAPFTGWRRIGARFCSEAALDLLVRLGALGDMRPVFVRGALSYDTIQPWQYSPADLTTLPCLDWTGAASITPED